MLRTVQLSRFFIRQFKEATLPAKAVTFFDTSGINWGDLADSLCEVSDDGTWSTFPRLACDNELHIKVVGSPLLASRSILFLAYGLSEAPITLGRYEKGDGYLFLRGGIIMQSFISHGSCFFLLSCSLYYNFCDMMEVW